MNISKVTVLNAEEPVLLVRIQGPYDYCDRTWWLWVIWNLILEARLFVFYVHLQAVFYSS